MNARRTGAAALCRTMVLPGSIVVWLVSGSADVERAGAQAVDHHAPVAVANSVPDAAPAIGSAAAASSDPADAGSAAPANVTTTADRVEAIVEAALSDPAQVLPDALPEQPSVATTPDAVPRTAVPKIDSVEILDECWVMQACVDRYLWALYQRAPKEDTIRVPEQRPVTIRKKRKTVTVMRTFTRLVDDDFTWKDPKAAARAGMPMTDYVIGGMDRGFKLRLFRALLAAEQAGLSPGITSAFRDDYRQSIASGLAAASNRSFHGGSLRGGYGHGLAADVVSVDGATRDERFAASLKLWKWIDAHKEFGIGRPYLGRDPAHLAPIDGREYVSRRGPSGGSTTVVLGARKRSRDSHGAKHHGNAKPTKLTITRAARRT
ncbi:hypothetical protein [Bradyrhizobium semiaridum]|uniref:hypothetical protein n=1 Tax=Bradyrhizobium semiaridum TaxID=2821404 RepID=UPI001CE2E6F5|nr:hypothetical protein [Bradyrhizobium semiaridum]